MSVELAGRLVRSRPNGFSTTIRRAHSVRSTEASFSDDHGEHRPAGSPGSGRPVCRAALLVEAVARRSTEHVAGVGIIAGDQVEVRAHLINGLDHAGLARRRPCRGHGLARVFAWNVLVLPVAPRATPMIGHLEVAGAPRAGRSPGTASSWPGPRSLRTGRARRRRPSNGVVMTRGRARLRCRPDFSCVPTELLDRIADNTLCAVRRLRSRGC